jgi:hypothetical protein
VNAFTLLESSFGGSGYDIARKTIHLLFINETKTNSKARIL